MTRLEIARAAFYGGNEALYQHLRGLHAYAVDGDTYPANGLTLAQVLADVAAMDADTLALFAVWETAIIRPGCFGRWYIVTPAEEWIEFTSQADAERYCAALGLQYVVR